MRISDWSADVCSSDLFILQVDDLLLRFEQHGRKNEYVPVQRGSVPRQRLDRLGDAVPPRCFFDRLSNEFFHVAHPNNSSASSGVRPRSSLGSSRSTFGDRQRVVEGRGESVRDGLGCRRTLKNKNHL